MIGKIKKFLSFDTAILLLILATFAARNENFFPVVAFFTTLPILWSALKSLKNKKISIDLLASIALIVSLINKQWTSVLFINLMITSARIFSTYTGARSRRALESLMKLKPQKAKIKIDGGFREVHLSDVRVGDFIVVELGEMIPVDGIVEKGEAEVDQSSLTGESAPVFKKEGDEVFGSTIVSSGNLLIKAGKIGKETVFEKIIDLVEKSQASKARIHTLSDKFSVWYIAIILLTSAALFFFSHNVKLVLSVLLVSCADDVAIAIPLAFLASITHAAKHGSIIKGGDYLEGLTRARVAVFDKTGTLTKGKLKVEKLFVFDCPEKEVLGAAGMVSLMSSHPSSHALKRYVDEKGAKISEPEKFEEYAGKGAMAVSGGKTILSGNVSFFQEQGIKIAGARLAEINGQKESGCSVSLIGIGNELAGFFTLVDELRPHAKEMVEGLKKYGIGKIVMLTGDNEKIAQRVAAQTGIGEFHANLLPEDKISYLKKYLNKKNKVIMIGDGVNDAAALSLADVSIAMGGIGSDAAIESADIALMKDDLRQIPELMKIGKSTIKIVHQDLWIWGAVNAVGLVLVFAGVIGPTGAAAYNFITDFFPLLNSMRLFR